MRGVYEHEKGFELFNALSTINDTRNNLYKDSTL